MSISVGAALLVSAIVTAIGTGVSAGVNAAETDEANAANMDIYNQSTARTQKQQGVQNRIAMEGLGLQREQFQQNKAVSNYAMVQDQVNGVLNLLNNNNTLTDRLLKNWS